MTPGFVARTISDGDVEDRVMVAERTGETSPRSPFSHPHALADVSSVTIVRTRGRVHEIRDVRGTTLKNLLLEHVEFKIDETNGGVWRRFLYPDGSLFEEYVSHARVLGLPLLHYTKGKNPQTGKRVVAVGFFAIGRMAFGVFALGQASAGVFAVGQLAVGMIVGLGQASTGVIALGQLAIGLAFGVGQFVTGYAAIGQFGIGRYFLGMFGLGQHVWDMRGGTDAAKAFFLQFGDWRSLKPLNR